MPTILAGYRISTLARSHARLGVYRRDPSVVQLLGGRPGLDSETYTEHQKWLQDQGGARLQDLKEVIAEREQVGASGNHLPPTAINFAIAFAVVVEAVGGAYLMSGFDLPDAHRLVFGLTFGLGLILFTAVVAKRTAPSSDGSSLRRGAGTLLVLLGYSLVIGSVVALRILDAERDGNRLQAIAEAIIMLVATAGPPWATDALVRMRGRSRLLHTELMQLRTDEREAVRDRATARTSLQNLSRESEAWDREAIRLRDIYDTEHALVLAALTSRPPDSQPQPDSSAPRRELPRRTPRTGRLP